MTGSERCFAKISLVIMRDEPILPFTEAALRLSHSTDGGGPGTPTLSFYSRGAHVIQLDQWEHFIPVAGSGRGV